jgi:hypothetical protein
LRILKDMRNPLMHPQESLEVYHAIDMLCICQAVIEKIIEDVSSQKLEEQFTNAWEALKKLKKLEDNTRSIRLNSFRLLNRYSKRQVFRRDFMIDPPLDFRCCILRLHSGFKDREPIDCLPPIGRY